MNSINEILSTLNPEQLEAANYTGGPCLIIAGAGTGKTKTLTCKVAKLIADGISPSRILAVTFTNKAAQEMRERIEALVPGNSSRVWIHTFHSFAVRILRHNAAALKLNKDFVIYDETEQKKIITLALEEMGVKEAKKEVNYYVSTISRAKDDMLDPESFFVHAHASNNPRRIQAAEVYKRYQRKLTAAGALDFGDLLMKVVELFKTNPDVLAYYQDFFKYVLVDEYQDTNHTQYTLTKALAAKHRNLCVVGDPDQSIYSWRGANIRNIMEFERDFKDAKVITLERNYRSTQIILDASNKLIRKNKNRREKTLYSNVLSGEPITVRELASEGEEARWVCNQIQTMVEEDGISLNDVAVFYRTNAQSRNFEDTFRRYQMPYKLIGAVKFYDRKEIKDVLSYAKLLVNPNDTVSLLRVINTPKRGFGQSAQDSLTAYAAQKDISLYKALKEQEFIDTLKPVARRAAREFMDLFESLYLEMTLSTPSELFSKLIERSGYEQALRAEIEKDPDAENRLRNIGELAGAVKDYEERCVKEETEPSLSGYLQEVSLISGAEEVSGSLNGAVTLMTVHLAKGLEFPAVFVTGLEEGLFPLNGKDDDDMEEERRLCYVAMTRAKKYLYMTYASTRRLFGKTYQNLASRFLFDSELLEPASYTGPMERTEINPRERYHSGGYNRWTLNNSVSYDNSDNYQETFKKFAPAFAKPEPARQEAPSPKTEGGIGVGSLVKHGVFGQGKVTAISGSGDNAKITVVFGNGTKRVFILKYAPLERL
ncbi:ATP-dependent helicase [Candidatus Proelusimicrobium excrementi]|uniref:ATP-dependent helicase n=2 Tax=Candidatus Proelusimicrobium excrementi TaxID=3416222 RepID=UPI003CB976A7|nr:UvrD-helicase domain-containing protein [Elusimicrobiaceae bacterium]